MERNLESNNIIISKKKTKFLKHSDGGIDLFSLTIFFLFLSVIMFSSVAFEDNMQLLFVGVSLLLFFSIVAFEFYNVPGRELSFYLVVPVLISATQNIYMGIIAPYVTSMQLQVMIVLNFLFAVMLCLFVYFIQPELMNKKIVKNTVWVLVFTVGYSLATIVLFHADPMSGFASLRNILNPIMFFLLGLITYKVTILKRFLKYVSYIALFVFLFGVYERFINPDVWTTLNLADLWTKKGLPVNPVSGLPLNYYSSESIGGIQMRRMVSSFADPVNLGTFLFFGFMAAWYLKKYLLALLMVVATALTISKGALLGLFVFLVVWAKNYTPKAVFVLITLCAGVAGAGFIGYTMMHSTMSTLMHMTGFFSAFLELPHHPLGRGLGNIGVLAGLYSQGAESGITESGFGMVIGQLGIVGIVLYFVFFKSIYKNIGFVEDEREKVLGYSLFLAITLNIAFNEVALSPNSSAVYFIALGLICGKAILASTRPKQIKKKKKFKKFVW